MFYCVVNSSIFQINITFLFFGLRSSSLEVFENYVWKHQIRDVFEIWGYIPRPLRLSEYGKPYGKTIIPNLKRVPHPKWGEVRTRIEAKMDDELGLGSNKVEIRRHRVREEIQNSAKTENDLQKKRSRDSGEPSGGRRLKRRRISADSAWVIRWFWKVKIENIVM